MSASRPKAKKTPAKKKSPPSAAPRQAEADDKLLSVKELLERLDSDANLPGEHRLDLAGGDGSGLRRGRFHRRTVPSRRDTTIASAEGSLLRLVERDGVLTWETYGEEVPGGAAPGLRAGMRRALVRQPGGVVCGYEFETLPASQAASALTALDKKLTPDADYGDDSAVTGLSVWDQAQGRQVPCRSTDCKIKDQKVLLFIHGTFSKSATFLSDGMKALMNDALDPKKGRYDRVLAFDHPTLSVSPFLNAFDLAARLRDLSGDGHPAQLDIVCHSRGGLVTRWYCEVMAPPGMKRRGILVACPLGGTSLAAPHRIREAFNLLTNVARVGSVAAGLFGGPFFLAAKGIMALTARITGALAGPLADAIVSLIPGFDAQSRTGNNPELRRLHTNTGGVKFDDPAGDVRYWSIIANFEPKNSGTWSFLRYFSRPLQTLANRGADFVFDGPNDLVVDTASMTEASRGVSQIQVLKDFGTQDTVHHTNYFDQAETVAKIREAFNIP